MTAPAASRPSGTGAAAAIGAAQAVRAATPADQVARRLARDGYVLLTDVVPPADVDRLRAAVSRVFPSHEELAAEPERWRDLRWTAFFPYEEPALNLLALHERVAGIAGAVLGTGDLRLGDSVFQAKYGTRLGPTKDQRLHHDAFEGASLVAPRPRGEHQRVFVIHYVTDVTTDLAPTYVVPRGSAPAPPMLSAAGLASYDAEGYPELYAAERPVLAPANSALVTLGDTIHRGSAMRAERGHRFALFANYHGARATWQRQPMVVALPGDPRSRVARELMAAATPRQRGLLGFPMPGDGYWDDETLRLTASLYPELDLTPYR